MTDDETREIELLRTRLERWEARIQADAKRLAELLQRQEQR